MVAAFDSVGPSAAGAGISGATPLTWNHVTVGALTTVLVFVSVDGIATSSPATCTLGGVSMTSIGITPSGSGGTTGFAQMFRLDNVAAGTHAMSVASATATDMEGGSVAFTGVIGLGTVALNSATAGSGTVNVPSSSGGNIIFAGVAAGNSVSSTTAPAASRFVNNLKGITGNATGNAAGATSAAGGSVTTTWVLAGSSPFAAIAVEVQGSPGGLASPQLPPEAFAPLSRVFGPNPPFFLAPQSATPAQAAAPVPLVPNWIPPFRRYWSPVTRQRLQMVQVAPSTVPANPIRSARPYRWQFRTRLSPQVPGPGAVSQPLPAIPSQLPQRHWQLFRRQPIRPVAPSGGVSQPISVKPVVPSRAQRKIRRDRSQPVPAAPSAIAQPAVRRWRFPIRRLVAGPAVPAQVATAVVPVAPGIVRSRSRWLLFRRPAQRPVAPSGGVSQPLPALPSETSRRQYRRPPFRISAQVPGPGAITQPIPVWQPRLSRRVLWVRRLVRSSAAPGPSASAIPPVPPRPLRPGFLRRSRTAIPFTAAPIVPATAAPAPGPSTRQVKLTKRWRSAQLPAPGFTPSAAAAAPARVQFRRPSWLRRRSLSAAAVPGPVAQAPPSVAPQSAVSRRTVRPRRSAPVVPGLAVQPPVVNPPAPRKVRPRLMRLRTTAAPPQVTAPSPGIRPRPPRFPLRRSRSQSAITAITIPPAPPATPRTRIWRLPGKRYPLRQVIPTRTPPPLIPAQVYTFLRWAARLRRSWLPTRQFPPTVTLVFPGPGKCEISNQPVCLVSIGQQSPVVVITNKAAEAVSISNRAGSVTITNQAVNTAQVTDVIPE